MDITYQEYKTLIDTGEDVHLLDVRELSERQKLSIGGEHIPLGELPKMLTTLPVNKKIVCYCHSGVRSAHACLMIMDKFPQAQAYNLAGGVKDL